MELDQQPWDRIAHFNGRASNVSEALRALFSSDTGQSSSGFAELRTCLEHQDGVIQATPVAVHFLLRQLERPPAEVNPKLFELLLILLDAAAFQMENMPSARPDVTLEDLIAPEKLMPVFVSEDEDEALWENGEIPGDHAEWAALTFQQIVAARETLQHHAAASEANELLRRIDQLRESVESPAHNKPAATEHSKPWWKLW